MPASSTIDILTDYAVVHLRSKVGGVALVDLADVPLVEGIAWYASKPRNVIYAYNPRMGQMHCRIMGDKGIDHVDGDGLNNRRINLRIASHMEQGANAPSRKNKSKYKGVVWHNKGNKWQAQLRANGAVRYLGLYQEEEEAARAYNVAAIESCGEFARLNEV